MFDPVSIQTWILSSCTVVWMYTTHIYHIQPATGQWRLMLKLNMHTDENSLSLIRVYEIQPLCAFCLISAFKSTNMVKKKWMAVGFNCWSYSFKLEQTLSLWYLRAILWVSRAQSVHILTPKLILHTVMIGQSFCLSPSVLGIEPRYFLLPNEMTVDWVPKTVDRVPIFVEKCVSQSEISEKSIDLVSVLKLRCCITTGMELFQTVSSPSRNIPGLPLNQLKKKVEPKSNLQYEI